MARPVRVIVLYPTELGMYGERGNLITVVQRLRRRRIGVELQVHRPGDSFQHGADLVLAGGGQDSTQLAVHADLQRIRTELAAMARDEVPMLLVCAAYQLAGHLMTTADGTRLHGLDILDVETVCGSGRIIGYTEVHSASTDLVGFQNHGGRTRLGPAAVPLGYTTLGLGNNGRDRTEGCRQGSVIGTYLHGPVLPLNPAFADELLVAALRRHGHSGPLEPLDDTLAEQARRRFRDRAGSRRPHLPHVPQPTSLAGDPGLENGRRPA